MKKQILFIIFLLYLTSSGFSQYKENFNVSLFTGAYFAQKNTNNQGYWYGAYGEYTPFKTIDDVSFGVAFLASNSSFGNNTRSSFYEGSSKQFGFGFTLGKYWDFFTFTHSAYLGGNLMLKKAVDEGEGTSWTGYYEMKQEDILISSEINFNLFKAYTSMQRFFPRTQLKVGFQRSLVSEKEDYWNGKTIPESVIWDKAGLSTELKLSFIELGSFENLTQIKAFIGYQNFSGDQSHWLFFGPEVSFKKEGKDDWFIISLFIKQKTGRYKASLNDTHFGFNLVVIINNIKKIGD